MKKAYVHDWIVHEGGAEAVLRDLIQQDNYSQAKLFVLFSRQPFFVVSSGSEEAEKEVHIPITTALPTWINNIFIFFNTHKVFFFSKLLDYRNLMFWFPVLCRILRKKILSYNPDQITISSFAAVKNIVPPIKKRTHSQCKEPQFEQDKNNTNTQHYIFSNFLPTTLYLHSPMQYIWENYDENVKKLTFPIKQFYQIATKYLRPWDTLPREYDTVLCNSNYTAELAKQLYQINGQISYPPINKAFFDEPIATYPKPYFVFVGRVQRYVREIDKVITLCNKTHTPLIVLGDGPDMEYAKSLAGSSIIFVGHIADVREKIAIVKHASGLINLAKESFGIATYEALCLGVPVLGYSGGATKELINQTNGYIVTSKDQASLEQGLEEFNKMHFDREVISHTARTNRNLSTNN